MQALVLLRGGAPQCCHGVRAALLSSYTTTAAAHAAAGNPDQGHAADGNERQQDAPEGAGASSTGSSSSGSSAGRAPHVSLEHPDLKVYLRHNASFKTDEERLFKIGMIAAMDRKGKAELRKALAAHRLALRDAAGAPAAMHGSPSSLLDRMTARLAEMEAEARRIEGQM